MKTIIATDSTMLDNRLINILSGISSLEIIASVKDVQEAFEFIKVHNPEILIISLKRISQSALNALREVKLFKEEITVIVLSTDSSVEYNKVWGEYGANYIFDQAIHLNRMVDVLCDLLYKKQFNSIKAERANINNQSGS